VILATAGLLLAISKVVLGIKGVTTATAGKVTAMKVAQGVVGAAGIWDGGNSIIV